MSHLFTSAFNIENFSHGFFLLTSISFLCNPENPIPESLRYLKIRRYLIACLQTKLNALPWAINPSLYFFILLTKNKIKVRTLSSFGFCQGKRACLILCLNLITYLLGFELGS